LLKVLAIACRDCDKESKRVPGEEQVHPVALGGGWGSSVSIVTTLRAGQTTKRSMSFLLF